jgi:hypothetical protein
MIWTTFGSISGEVKGGFEEDTSLNFSDWDMVWDLERFEEDRKVLWMAVEILLAPEIGLGGDADL